MTPFFHAWRWIQTKEKNSFLFENEPKGETQRFPSKNDFSRHQLSLFLSTNNSDICIRKASQAFKQNFQIASHPTSFPTKSFSTLDEPLISTLLIPFFFLKRNVNVKRYLRGSFKVSNGDRGGHFSPPATTIRVNILYDWMKKNLHVDI